MTISGRSFQGTAAKKDAPGNDPGAPDTFSNISPLSPVILFSRRGDVNREKKAESIVFGWSWMQVKVFYKETPLNLKRIEKIIKASIASKIRRPIIWPGVLRFSRDGFNLLGFKTSPQCGHVAAAEETCFLQVGQLISVAILFLLIDVGGGGDIDPAVYGDYPFWVFAFSQMRLAANSKEKTESR